MTAVIKFGPAAAPRWFDQDRNRFEQYLDLLTAAGASAIEFVVLPGAGSDELGRVHLTQLQWSDFIRAAQSRKLTINLHAPLPSEFRLVEWAYRTDAFVQKFDPVRRVLNGIAEHQSVPPVLVMHAASEDPELTALLVRSLLVPGEIWSIALELRAPSGESDRRFDRDLDSLAMFVAGLEDPRIGICWDLAHDWESDGHISFPTDEQLALIKHVHVHGARADGHVHNSLLNGTIPWGESVTDLVRRGWRGSITLEIRYRYASEIGEPWSVLRGNLEACRNVLAQE